jgi:hypothetical protein
MNTVGKADGQLTAWLFDAGALSAEEVERLRHIPTTQWLYDHIGDAQAEALGPVLAPPEAAVQTLAAQIGQDAERAWAVNRLWTDASLAALARHLRSLRYIHTQDKQRYYWRFADSRCLTALWQELTPRQQSTVRGPIHGWQFLDRECAPQHLELTHVPAVQAASHPLTALRLTDQQLSGLLDTVWPDQLLASIREQRPDIAGHLSPAAQHRCAQAVSDWLRQVGEDRYPIQQTVLLQVLDTAQPDWSTPQWHQASQHAHQHASH